MTNNGFRARFTPILVLVCWQLVSCKLFVIRYIMWWKAHWNNIYINLVNSISTANTIWLCPGNQLANFTAVCSVALCLFSVLWLLVFCLYPVTVECRTALGPMEDTTQLFFQSHLCLCVISVLMWTLPTGFSHWSIMKLNWRVWNAGLHVYNMDVYTDQPVELIQPSLWTLFPHPSYPMIEL